MSLVVRFRKPETRTNAPQRHNTLQTWRSRRARVKLQLFGTWPGRLPYLCEFPLFYASCVRVGEKLRANPEATSGEGLNCPDLRLRSGRNTPFRWIFLLEIVKTDIRLHMQCTQIFLSVNVAEIKIYDLHQGTINSGLRSTKNEFDQYSSLQTARYGVRIPS